MTNKMNLINLITSKKRNIQGMFLLPPDQGCCC